MASSTTFACQTGLTAFHVLPALSLKYSVAESAASMTLPFDAVATAASLPGNETEPVAMGADFLAAILPTSGNLARPELPLASDDDSVLREAALAVTSTVSVTAPTTSDESARATWSF